MNIYILMPIRDSQILERDKGRDISLIYNFFFYVASQFSRHDGEVNMLDLQFDDLVVLPMIGRVLAYLFISKDQHKCFQYIHQHLNPT